MPRVLLLRQFIKHYAGSVYDIDDGTGIDNWVDDELMREKHNTIISSP
jgi:hypothetical protein